MILQDAIYWKEQKSKLFLGGKAKDSDQTFYMDLAISTCFFLVLFEE